MEYLKAIDSFEVLGGANDISVLEGHFILMGANMEDWLKCLSNQKL